MESRSGKCSCVCQSSCSPTAGSSISKFSSIAALPRRGMDVYLSTRVLTGLRAAAEFHLVSLGVDDPGELAVLRVVDLLEHVAAFFLQRLHECVEVVHAVV